MVLQLTNMSRKDAAYMRSWVKPLCPITKHPSSNLVARVAWQQDLTVIHGSGL